MSKRRSYKSPRRPCSTWMRTLRVTAQVLEPPEPIIDEDAFFATLSTDPCSDTLTDGVTRIVETCAQTNTPDPDDAIDVSERTDRSGLAQCVFTLALPDDTPAEVRIDTLTITALPAAKNPVIATPAPLGSTNLGLDSPSAVPGHLIEAEYPPSTFTPTARRYDRPQEVRRWFDGVP